MKIAAHETPLIKPFSGIFFSGWLGGMVIAYFAAGFLSNFYPTTVQFILLGLIFQVLCGISLILLLNKAQLDWHKDRLTLATLALASFAAVSAIAMVWQFPSLFNRRILFMDPARLALFSGLAFAALFGISTFLKTLERNRIHEPLYQNAAFLQLQNNLPGIVLALIFLLAYLTLAETINFPNFQTLDQYFDIDIAEWLKRLVTPERQNVIAVRAVHPAVLIFIRPVIWFTALFLNGDRLQAVFLVNALAGAACVFVFWLIVKQFTKNTAYALIMASILGTSTAHLIFSSMLETYIYSALALIVFVLVTQGGEKSLTRTVPVGILVFGITITNFVQTCILYLLAAPKLKTIFKYIVLVFIAVALLNILQVWIYPKAQSFLQPANFLVEQNYRFTLTRAPWQVTGRIALIVRAVLLYGIVAPRPFILMEELGAVVPNFRTFEVVIEGFNVAGYVGAADVTVKFWILIVAIAGVLFLLDLFKTPKQMLFPVSLVLCLGFNLVLHINYGDDPLLYAPDWVYALVLFVAFAFRKYADNQWLQILMLVFLGLLIQTNFRLIQQIIEVSLPFYG